MSATLKEVPPPAGAGAGAASGGATAVAVAVPAKTVRLRVVQIPNVLGPLDAIFKRDEADILFIAGNVALVGLEIIEWPVAALTLILHAMSRSRIKALRVVAEVAEEAE